MQSSEPVLDRVLRPSPPMAPRALFVIVAIFAGLNFLIAGYFVAQGAWPVTPFLGIDVALLIWALNASIKASRQEEQVTLTRDFLSVVRRAPGKPPGEYRLNPYWVRVQMDEPPEHERELHQGIAQASNLILWSHGKGLALGRFLSPMVRAEVGAELKAALRKIRS